MFIESLNAMKIHPSEVDGSVYYTAGIKAESGNLLNK